LGYKEPKDNEMAKLSNFYGKLTQAIRSAESVSGKQHTIFFEPAIQWKGLEELALNDANFTTDENIVFAPHSYFEAIGNASFSIEQGFGILQFGSQTLYKTALFIGEWGFFGNPASDVEKVKRFAVVEDKNFVSSTWWQWSQSPGDPHGISWDGNTYDPTSMHLIELNQSANFTGNVNTIYLKVLGRARPNAIVGKPTLLTSNADHGTMHLEATAITEGVTELWIPDFFGIPKITGNNASLKELKTVAGGYKAFVKVLKGNYTIDVSY
jgi:endoglycosylceramidase